MTETWAISGVDLNLDLTGTRVRAALESALCEAARTGRLGPGARLPSSRTLARDLGIARNTVADAYGQLVPEGWLTARQGSGTRVAERAGPVDSPTPRPETSATYAELSPTTSPAPAGSESLPTASGLLGVHPRVRVAVPRTAYTRSGGRGARGIHPARHPRHRPQQRTEDPDAAGRHPRAAISELTDAGAVLLTPAHQFPLGVPLAAQRRAQAVARARHTEGLVIDDDYDGEFRYDRQPLASLQALAPEHVVYAGTASKSLAPGLRLAWLVLPAHLIDEVVETKTLADRQTSNLEQLTLAEFIRSGAYDRHVRRSRLTYRRRRDRLVAALQRHVPQVRITGIAAGLHALLELPIDHREEEVIARATQHSLALEGLHAYADTPQPHRRALVVGYGAPSQHGFTAAIARLCAVLAELSQPRRPHRHGGDID